MEDLKAADFTPAEELMSIATDENRDLDDRISAASQLKNLGFLEDQEQSDMRKSPLGMLGYIRVQNRRMRKARETVTPYSSGSQSERRVTAVGDGQVLDESTSSALHYFDWYTEPNTGAQSYIDLKCGENCLETDRNVEADGIKEGFEKDLTRFYRSAAAEFGEDAERIANRAKAFTIWHLPGSEDTVYDPVDMCKLLQESIKASRKSDQFSNNSQTLGTSGS